jgi:TonB family protein
MKLPAVPSLMFLCSCIAFAFPVSATDVPSIKPASRAYAKLMADKIGSLWYREIEKDPNLVAVGTARVSFRVTPSGRVANPRITSNTSNKYFANICLRAIQEAKLPPIPQSVLREANKKWIDFDIPFTVFPPGK